MKALAHWRHYLSWTKTPFIIHTDHANLQYWKSPRNLNHCTARWHTDLQKYNYILEYIPGKTNTATDVLSRPPGKDHGEEDNKDVTIIPPHRAQTAKTLGGRTIVPNIKEIRRAILRNYHNLPTAGCSGRDETLRKIQEHYWWPGAKDWVAEYIKGCTVCQQLKILMHKKHILLYPIPTEENMPPFQVVAMDLITGLQHKKGLMQSSQSWTMGAPEQHCSYHAPHTSLEQESCSYTSTTSTHGMGSPGKSLVTEIQDLLHILEKHSPNS